MPETVTPARCLTAILAALAIFAGPIESAFAQKPSTPVTVVNPANSPVPTTVTNPATSPALTSKIDDPGRVPYQVKLAQYCSTKVCNFSSAPVLKEHRLIIQHVSAFALLAGTADSVLVGIGPSSGQAQSAFFAQLGENGQTAAVDQAVLLFVDGDQDYHAEVRAHGANFTSDTPVVLTITGYLLDCTAAPCAVIAP